jgi:signal peptidase I
MQVLTGIFLASVLGYVASWYFGALEGNFDLLLFLVSAVTGCYWLAERFYFEPRRQAAAAQLEKQAALRRADLQKMGIAPVEDELATAKETLLRQPWWLDWTAGMFPVIVTVFLFRSFLVEPFKIPSGSMMPTMLVGDLILVNKYEYGFRLPVLHTKLTQGAAPQRGDVMVFRFPPQPSQNYIKRVVGLPGDEVSYLNKELKINGQPVSKNAKGTFLDEDSLRYHPMFEESLGKANHLLLNYENSPPTILGGLSGFPSIENCRYSIEGVVCKVPAGHYFMMGDNRDNSLDSRFWGFVPEENIVGRAFFIWMNLGNIKRIGTFQ